jgi:hypothetical protein
VAQRAAPFSQSAGANLSAFFFVIPAKARIHHIPGHYAAFCPRIFVIQVFFFAPFAPLRLDSSPSPFAYASVSGVETII